MDHEALDGNNLTGKPNRQQNRWRVVLAAVVLSLTLIVLPIVRAENSNQSSALEKLRPPRYLKNPETIELGAGSSVTFLRTTDDTCGLYTWGSFEVAPGMGAPPHLHYGEEEWFIPTQPGEIRMFSSSKPAKAYPIGQLPGHNTLAMKEMGSATINKGDVLYSPKANIHYFSNEQTTPVTQFLNIWAPGFGIRNMFRSFNKADYSLGMGLTTGEMTATKAETLLAYTGLWGVPHDITGSIVGNKNYNQIRGSIFKNPNRLDHLQDLIDAGERCYPANGMRPSPKTTSQ